MTASLNNLAAPWEVWLAHVRFADKPKAAKVRPVVIIDSDADPKVAAKVTSCLITSRNGTAPKRAGSASTL